MCKCVAVLRCAAPRVMNLEACCMFTELLMAAGDTARQQHAEA